METIILDDFEDLFPPYAFHRQTTSRDSLSSFSCFTDSVTSYNSTSRATKHAVHSDNFPPSGKGKSVDACSDSSSDVVIVDVCNSSSPLPERKPYGRVLRSSSLINTQANYPPASKLESGITSNQPTVEKKQQSIIDRRPTRRSTLNLRKEPSISKDPVQPSLSEPLTTIGNSPPKLSVVDIPSPNSCTHVEPHPSWNYPKVHDLIDTTAAIGATLFLSENHHNTVIKKYSASEKSVESSSREVIKFDYPLLSNLLSNVCNSSTLPSVDRHFDIFSSFNIRHPFLYSWEKDEDRVTGGEWRSRKRCYQTLLDTFDPVSAFACDTSSTSDLENDPHPAKKDLLRKAGCTRKSSIENSTESAARSSCDFNCLPWLEPQLLGYRWLDADAQPSATSISPQKMTFWL